MAPVHLVDRRQCSPAKTPLDGASADEASYIEACNGLSVHIKKGRNSCGPNRAPPRREPRGRRCDYSLRERCEPDVEPVEPVEVSLDDPLELPVVDPLEPPVNDPLEPPVREPLEVPPVNMLDVPPVDPLEEL